MKFILLVLLIAGPTSALEGSTRLSAFNRAADAEALHGDQPGEAHFRSLAGLPPEIPPTLSERAIQRHPDYAAHYNELRARVAQAITYPDYAAEDHWRVDRAEADLRLVAYELDKGARAASGLVQQFLHDASWALDHHIAVKPPDFVVAAAVPIARIQANPPVIAPGECSMLTWSTENATEAFINGENVSLTGSKQVCPDFTASYNLEADGPGGRAMAWATVTVSAPTAPPHYRIHFDFDQSVIRPDAIDTMAAVARLMRDAPALSMRLEGHTDAIGTDEYNMGLGMRRAQSVRDFFVERYGVNPTRFQLVSKGEREPIAPNSISGGNGASVSRGSPRDNPAGRQLNRRAEFIEIR